jgi:hypothetical protein
MNRVVTLLAERSKTDEKSTGKNSHLLRKGFSRMNYVQPWEAVPNS